MSFKYFVPRPRAPHHFESDRIILVEGMDDALFFEAVLVELEIAAKDVEVHHVQGYPNFEDYLKALAKAPVVTSGQLIKLCVIVDADGDAVIREEDIQQKLRAAGFSAPSAGAFQKSTGPEVGLFVLPDNSSPGELEDLFLEALKSDSRLLEAISSLDKFDPDAAWTKRSKRLIQIMLALSEQALCAGIGRGLRNGAVPLPGAELDHLKDFLEEFLS